MSWFFKNKDSSVVDAIELVDVSFQAHDDVPTLLFDIYVEARERVVGRVEYRFETGRDLLYYGNIGYVVYTPYRGKGFAYRACELLFEHLRVKYPDIHEVFITCNPDNIASKKTIQKLQATFIETVDVAPDHELHYFGDTQKEIYVVYL